MLSPKSQAFRSAVPDTCGMCHTDVAEQYRASVHGQALARGIPEAPLCTDCHGEHKIIKPSNADSPVNAAHIRDTCGSCHGNVRLTRKFGLPSDRLISFDASYHGLAAKEGSQTVANCASCHGVHNILPSSDPKSTINPKNLPRTCGKCHPGAGTRFAISQVHLSETGAEPAPLRWVREFYLLVIPVTIGLMLLHNGGDWVRKLIAGALRAKRRTAARRPWRRIRMLPFERVQHAVLALSFLTLVWTGFALKYPDQWWARPLLLMEGRYSMRSLIHRVAASVFMAISVTHVVSLIVSRKLREHWKEMLPTMNDPREALSNFAYNLGLGDQPPGRSAHSYVEKAEYWAVVWGAVVMAATGVTAVGQQYRLEAAAQGVAGRGHLRALLRSPAGHPGHCGLALLHGYFRSRCLPAEYRLPHRRERGQGRSGETAWRPRRGRLTAILWKSGPCRTAGDMVVSGTFNFAIQDN